MKGKILKLRNMLTMAILVACLIGCGNQESTTTEPTTEVEEPTVTEKPTDEVESEEVEEKEEVAEELTETEEVAYITDYTSINDFMISLDPSKPAIIIYNDVDNYIVKIEEGQHYNLKSEDHILINTPTAQGRGYNTELIPDYKIFGDNADELLPDYSKFEDDQEFFFSILFYDDEDGIPDKLTCYLTAPTE